MAVTEMYPGRWYLNMRIKEWNEEKQDYTEKQKRIFLSTDHAHALRLHDEWQQKRDLQKTGKSPENMLSQVFFDLYLESRRGYSNARTLEHDARAIRLFKREFPIHEISKIEPKLLMELQMRWLKQNVSNHSINRRMCTLKCMMRWAEKNGYLERCRNWDQIKKLPVTEKRNSFYSRAQLKFIIDSMEGRWKTFTLIGAKAGLRLGEILNLRKKDVNLDSNGISVESQEGWHTKNRKNRVVPLANDLKHNIINNSNYKDISQNDKMLGFNLNGDYSGYTKISNSYIKILKKIAIPESATMEKMPGSAHTLRHTFASHLAMTHKVHISEIQVLMGHASVKQTEVYAHLLPVDKNIIDLLPDY